MEIFMEAVLKVAIGLLSAVAMDMRLLEHVQAHVTHPQQDGNQRYQDAIVNYHASIFICFILVLTKPLLPSCAYPMFIVSSVPTENSEIPWQKRKTRNERNEQKMFRA